MITRRNFLALVLAGGVSAIAMPSPSVAQVAVKDVPAFKQRAIEFADAQANRVETLARWAEQINNMVELVTLQNIAKTALGEGMGPEFARLAVSTQGLYQKTSQLIGNVSTKQMELQSEFDSLLVPGGLENMTPQQLFAMVHRYRAFFSADTIQARAIHSEGIALQEALHREAMNGVAQSDRSVSALSATQSLSHIAGAIASQLQTTNYTLGKFALEFAALNGVQMAGENVMQEVTRRNNEHMKEWLARKPAQTKQSPIRWGRP